MIQCSINYNEDGGIDQVLAPNGAVSNLYNTFLKNTDGDREAALQMWAVAYVPTFSQKIGDWQSIKRVYNKPGYAVGEDALVFSQQSPNAGIELDSDILFADTRTGFVEIGDSQVKKLVDQYNKKTGASFKFDYNNPNLLTEGKGFFDFVKASGIRGFYAGNKTDSDLLIVLDKTRLSNYDQYRNILDTNGEPIYRLLGPSAGFTPLSLPKITQEEIKSSVGARARALVKAATNRFIGLSPAQARGRILEKYKKPGVSLVDGNRYDEASREVRDYNATQGKGLQYLSLEKSGSDYKLLVNKEPASMALNALESLNLAALNSQTMDKIESYFMDSKTIPALNDTHAQLVNAFIAEPQNFISKSITLEFLSNLYNKAYDSLTDRVITPIQKNSEVVTKDGTVGVVIGKQDNMFRVIDYNNNEILVKASDLEQMRVGGVPIELRLPSDYKEIFNINKQLMDKFFADPQQVANSIVEVQNNLDNLVKFDTNLLNAVTCK